MTSIHPTHAHPVDSHSTGINVHIDRRFRQTKSTARGRLPDRPMTGLGCTLVCVVLIWAAVAQAQVLNLGVAIPATNTLPEYPALTGFEDPNGLVPPSSAVSIFDSEYTANYIPAIRTSSDGRVTTGYVGIDQERLRFQLFRPEAHAAAVAAAGGPVDPNTSGFVSDFMDLYVVDPDQGVNIVGEGNFRHMTLCDGSTLLPGDTANPQTCGSLSDPRDCYDLVAIVSVQGPASEPDRVDLYRVPVQVEVSQPKTEFAEIASISADWNENSTTPALTINGTKSFFEPVFDRTGRLFVGRLGNAPNLAHANENIDIVYGVTPNEPGLPDCDPSTWVDGLKPISHAHHDPAMWIGPVYTGTPRFGIAAYPIRDTEGNVIPDGDDVMATYPWMDREGNNLFFTTVHATLHWQDPGQPGTVKTRYPTRGATFPFLGGLVSLDLTDPADQTLFEAIVPQSIEEIGLWPWLNQFEQDSEKRGAATAGLWTRGKMVLLDNRLTFTDYGMRPEDPVHRELLLYAPGSDLAGAADGYARIGSGTASGWFGVLQQPNFGWYSPPHYPGNPAVIDSLESLFAHHHDLRSGRPRDVVWAVGDGDALADMEFDDWLNPDAFIVSSMMATVTFNGPEQQLANINRMTYHDGFVETNSLFRGNGWGGEIHLQNAATTLPNRWKIPDYGLGESVRIEPIGRGGAEGRGVWLGGASDSVGYTVESQPQDVSHATWYVGVHLDARIEDDGVVRRILTFPDGSHVALGGRSRIHLRRGDDENVHTVFIPPALTLRSRGWSHLGLRVRPGGRAVEVLLDGYPLDRWECPPVVQLKPKKNSRMTPRKSRVEAQAQNLACPPLFSMQPGQLTLGHRGSGPSFRGWVDDLRVFAAEPGAEVACNHARGTLIQLIPGAVSKLIAQANAYPNWAHQKLDDALGNEQGSYLCFRKDDPSKTSVADLPPRTEGVRTQLIFPESSQLTAGAPRPDSSNNSFCLSCHTADGVLGLGVDALSANGISLEDDLRRQPSQSPMRVGGVIPANWLGTGLPASTIMAPEEGFPLDYLVHPASGP